jgi:acyl-coenzyme A synthetase/AMP-(fatty) acid ligase
MINVAGSPEVIDVATGDRATWDQLMRQARRCLDAWRLVASNRHDTITVTPRRGIKGIIDLLAAYCYDGPAAIVPAEYLELPYGELVSRECVATGPTTIAVRDGEIYHPWHDLPISGLMSSVHGRRIFAASGGSTGMHRVGEIPVGNLTPLPAAYRMTGLEPASRMYVGGPWSHSAFAWAFFSALESGSTLIVASQFRPRQVASALNAFGATWALMPPTEFHALSLVMRQNAWNPSHLRSVVTTGGRTRVAAREDWYRALAPGRVFDMYATTEGIGVLLANGEEQRRRPGTSGRPVWAKVQLRDNRNGVLTTPGAVGRLFMKSLSRAPGRSSRFRSAGDLARLDGDGYVYLMGRADDEVVIEGLNVNLQELARLVERSTGIDEAIVLQAGSASGQVRYLGAVVVGQEDVVNAVRLKATPLIAKLFGPLAVPRRWLAVSALPMTPNGKVDRRELRRQFKGLNVK